MDFYGEVVVMIRMLCLNLARHWHGLMVQLQGRNCILWGLLRWVHEFISTVLCVVEWESSSFQCRAQTPIIDHLSDYAPDVEKSKVVQTFPVFNIKI